MTTDSGTLYKDVQQFLKYEYLIIQTNELPKTGSA